MNLELVYEIINDYKEISSESDKSIYDERGLLSRIRENVEWASFTDDQKHRKRCVVYSVIRKTGNTEEFKIETKIIELYELVEVIINKVKVQERKNELDVRLVAMLEVFRYHVNEHRDTRDMNTSSFDLIEGIVSVCLQDNLFDSIRNEFNMLILLLAKVRELLSDRNSVK